MASESRGIIRSHWREKGARFSEGRPSQCISNSTELEIRLREDTGNTWLEIISKVRATFLYLRHHQNSRRAGSRRDCSICHWQPTAFCLEFCWQAGNPSRPPNCHSSGKWTKPKEQSSTSSWQPPPLGNSYANASKNFPDFPPWGFSLGFCFPWNQRWNWLQSHYLITITEHLKLEVTHKNHRVHLPASHRTT